MKIVIDARELRTSTGRYVERLLHYLQQIDTTNKYIVLLKPKDMDGWQPTSKRFQKVASRYKEFSFGEQLGFWWQIHKLKADLVHFTMVQQPILYRGKVVTTMHDLTTTRFRNPAKNWLVFTIKQWVYKWVNKRVARKSRAILTGTEFVKEDVAKFARINSRKITVTPEAADKIEETAALVEDLEGASFIMYVGRPTPHKNLERLIQAFAINTATHPGLKLVLVGKRDRNYIQLKRYAKRTGVGNVHFTGFIDDSQLKWLYEHARAYVFPSLSEGFGLPPLEAMMHSCPVVSSNATCLPEVNGDAALYFDPTDIEDMAAQINKVLGNEKLREDLIAKGKKQAAKYSWRRMAEQTLAVYNEVVDSTQRV